MHRYRPLRNCAWLCPILLALTLVAPASDAQHVSLSPARFQRPLSAEFEVRPIPNASQRSVQFCIVDFQLGSSIQWDFGDGQTSKQKDPKHTYAVPGSYTVQLKLSNTLKSASSSQDLFISDVPLGFVDELVFKTNLMTTGVLVIDQDDFITWSKEGTVWRWRNGAYASTPMLDIKEEVGNWGDHGLLRFVMHPDYATNGYVYALYVVDRYYLDNFGQPGYDPALSLPQTESVARLTRYTVFDPSDPGTSVDPSTRLIVLGAGIADGLPVCATSHGVGGLEFAQDGTLLLSFGDAWLGNTLQNECLSANILSPKTFIRAFRAQLLDSPNGKLLRINPNTGAGDPSNPFYDAQNPSSWSSRVWALGLRNPYSFAIRSDEAELQRLHSGPGVIYLADVGSINWEELNVIHDGGANLGFPLWEGMAPSSFWNNMNTQNLDAPNPLFGAACPEPFLRFEDLIVQETLNTPSWPNRCDLGVQVPASIPRFMHQRPAITWLHGDQLGAPSTLLPGFDGSGNAISLEIDDAAAGVQGKRFAGNSAIAGTWFDGGAFPAPYDNVLFNADFGEGWIKAFEFDDQHVLQAVHDFAFPEGRPIMFLTKDPAQRALYYLVYQTTGRGLYRIAYDVNAAPVAAAQATPRFGQGPLRVELSASDSNDPEGDQLSIAWDFGDDQPPSPLNLWETTVHIFGAEDISAGLQPITNAAGGSLLGTGRGAPGAAKLGGRLRANLPRIQDGVYGALGSASSAEQELIEAARPWVGYRIFPKREVTGLIYQEGLNGGSLGGTLQAPCVEFYDDRLGRWQPVNGLQLARALPGDPNVSFESFHFSFDPVVTHFIRLRDAQAGALRFSVAELRVLAAPSTSNPQPAGFLVDLSVTDSEGLYAEDNVLVTINNTPPLINMISPALGQTYAVGAPINFPMTASLSDAEHSSSELSCAWSVELVHDNHSHPEPLDTNCDTSLLLQPHNELEGDVIYWRFTLTVSDALGLESSVTRDLIPMGDCNLNGILDATDIASGSSLDANLNGIPDECE